MILIIGGAYQGKLEFARQLKGTDVTVSDGRTISLDLLAASDMITHFHEVILDIGVHQDGLVHISQICDRFIKHPLEAVSVGDIVDVQVISVDVAKKRIALTMKIKADK